jgi:hypothetical protein
MQLRAEIDRGAPPLPPRFCRLVVTKRNAASQNVSTRARLDRDGIWA